MEEDFAETSKEEKILKEEIDEIVVIARKLGEGNIAHIPNEHKQPLCRHKGNKYLIKDPETWRLWSWDNRRLCKKCKQKYLKQKEFLKEHLL